MKRISLNNGWAFNHGINTAMAAGFMGASVQQQTVDLPHDGMIAMERSPEAPAGASNGFFQTENCEYTKTFSLPADDGHKVVYLECGGAYGYASVQVNGDYAGACRNGYVDFLTELTDFIRPGKENTVKVTLKNEVQPNGRWYTGCGLYRGADLLVSGVFHIAPDGVRVTTASIQGDAATLEVETEVRWRGTGFKKGRITSHIVDADGKLVASVSSVFGIRSQETLTVRQRITIATPNLWSPETPTLYLCKTELTELPAEGMEQTAGATGPVPCPSMSRWKSMNILTGPATGRKTWPMNGGGIGTDGSLTST